MDLLKNLIRYCKLSLHYDPSGTLRIAAEGPLPIIAHWLTSSH